jgi:LmbE family N-acetylglucosaminyl deacetylase
VVSKLMVISPHADDAELGCGGYLWKTHIGGGKTRIAVVATGDIFFEHLGRVVDKEERKRELRASSRVLFASATVLFPGMDKQLDQLPIYRIVEEIEKEIKEFQPTEILIPLPSSHQDHDVVYRACLAATRPSNVTQSVQLIAAYEYAATSWGPGSAADAGRGGLYVDIGVGGLQKKLEALRCYRTQVRVDGHCWSEAAAEAMAKMRGLECGMELAELFHILRLVRR